MRCVSVRCGWSLRPSGIAVRSGRRSRRWLEKLGPTPETVSKWVRRTEVDEGRRPGLSSEERERLKRLERENRALDLAKGRIGAMPTPTGRPRIPVTATSGCTSDDDWRDAPAIKARLAGGHCLRAPAQGACPYANICEHCPSFRTDAASAAVLSAQRVDTRTLLADAQTRGWIDEADRHRRLRRRVVLLNPRARADITPLLAHPRPGPPRHLRLDRHLVQQKMAPLHQNPRTGFASSRAASANPNQCDNFSSFTHTHAYATAPHRSPGTHTRHTPSGASTAAIADRRPFSRLKSPAPMRPASRTAAIARGGRGASACGTASNRRGRPVPATGLEPERTRPLGVCPRRRCLGRRGHREDAWAKRASMRSLIW